MKRLYGRITKVDEEQRVVEGVISTEDEDLQGEVVTKEAIRKAIPDYMSLPGGGNLREMHQPSAVGKIPKVFQKNDETHVVAKVVDDAAWKKVKERVYTGFSIGGEIMKKVGNKILELRLAEISLVDRPANPAAMFTLVKIDGDILEKRIEDAMAISHIVAMLEEIAHMWRAMDKNPKPLLAAADKLRPLVGPEAMEKLDSNSFELLKFNLLQLVKMAKKKQEQEKEVIEETVEEVSETLSEVLEQEEDEQKEGGNKEVEEDEQEEEGDEGEEQEEGEESTTQIVETKQSAVTVKLTKLIKRLDDSLAKADVLNSQLVKAEALSALEERVERIEKAVSAGTKAKASYAVNRFEDDEDEEHKKMTKRYDELKQKNDRGETTPDERREAYKLHTILFSK